MLKQRVLELLRKQNGYISGQEICLQLGVSRTAVWKAVNSLKEEGYEIEAVKNRGYHLTEVPDAITEKEIRAALPEKYKDIELRAEEVIDSTNNGARKLAENGAAEGSMVTADIQTAGRGRRGRKWNNPGGTNIAMSVVLRPKIEANKAAMLTLLAALAIYHGVEDLTGLQCKIKWPNDLVLDGRKISGILTEMSMEEGDIRYVVVGIGVNVRKTEGLPPEVEAVAASLEEQGGRCRRADVIAAVYTHLMEMYEEFCRTGDLSFVQKLYNDRMAGKDSKIRIISAGESWEGINRGIDENGALRVEKDGQILTVIAGEVSIRGIFGYAPESE